MKGQSTRISSTIIPVASGKGGVGKSLFTANLAIALAMQGHSTIAVDLDLGGSNLHSYLGLANKNPGIGDFLKGKLMFSDLLVQTGIPNLRFIPGDGRMPFMANLPASKRVTITNELKKLKARYILLDLGAGTTVKTLEFYGLADKGIIITTVEPPAIMNFLVFLKNLIMRSIMNVVREDREIFSRTSAAIRGISGPLTVDLLLRKIAAVSPALANRAKTASGSWRPRIVFNMVDHPDDLVFLNKLDSTIKKNLSLDVDYFGLIFYDELIRCSARKKGPVMLGQADSAAAHDFELIAGRIGKLWTRPLTNSAVRLIDAAKKQYRRRQFQT